MAMTTECMLLAAEFDSIANTLEKAAKAPMRMIQTLNGMIMNAALDALQTTEAMFNSLAAQLGITAIEDNIDWLQEGLEILSNCSKTIGNNPLIQSAIGTDLASFPGATDPSQITGMTRKYAQAQAKRAAMAAIDKGMSAFGLGGQIGNTSMRYQQMLKGAGILDAIDGLNDIADCLSSLCEHAGSGPTQRINGYMSGLNLNPDKTVKNLWESQSTAAQAAINDTVARGTALQARVGAWTGGLF